MVAVAFAAVTKRFGGVEALRSLTLDVDDGTTCCLIGPSGSGKSTALRILAGLDDADDGEVRIGTRRVNDVPTRDRDLGLVAQTSALPTGRRVGSTMAMPLSLRGVQAREIDERIRAESRALGIIELLDRRPEQLSGGEARAVEVARAIVARPSVLLLDEPLAHLDPARRLELRADLRRLQAGTGVTTVWATADQADAMAVAERVAVLFDGRLQQVAPPLELFDRPRTIDVARFVGEPGIALLDARVTGAPGDLWYDLAGLRLRCRVPAAARFVGRSIVVGVRPHDVAVAVAAGGDSGTLLGAVATVEAQGHRTVVEVDLGGGVRCRAADAPARTRVGDRVVVVLDPARFHLFDPDTRVAVHHPT